VSRSAHSGPEGVLEDVWVTVVCGGLDGCGCCLSLSLASCFFPCLWCMPYEPSLARPLGAHERAVRHGPDPVL
jgi:pyruvate-formate lyase-activating enzyme